MSQLMNAINGEVKSSGEGTNWVCLMTQPLQEKIAKASLQVLGLSVYLPITQKLLTLRRKRVPLFSRYIFVSPGAVQSSLNDARRAKGVAGFGGRYLSNSLVSPRIIEAIRQRADDTELSALTCCHLSQGRWSSSWKVP
jgi:hypothetical protein